MAYPIRALHLPLATQLFQRWNGPGTAKGPTGQVKRASLTGDAGVTPVLLRLPIDFSHHGVSTGGNAWPERLGGDMVDEDCGQICISRLSAEAERLW